MVTRYAKGISHRGTKTHKNVLHQGFITNLERHSIYSSFMINNVTQDELSVYLLTRDEEGLKY